MIQKDKYLFFWGKNDFLSQWYPCGFSTEFIYLKRINRSRPVKVDILELLKMNQITTGNLPVIDKKVLFNCAEQFMMASKAALFFNLSRMKEILIETNPYNQKQIGKRINGYDENIWKLNREDIVYQASYYKFTQNKELLDSLIKTDGKILVEASPYDKIWGIGLSATDPKAIDDTKWNGLNLLGKTLTKLRDHLIYEKKPN